MLDNYNLVDRARTAYFRYADSSVDQPTEGGHVVNHDGRTLVVLSNGYRVLAAYRLASGRLRRTEVPNNLATAGPDWVQATAVVFEA